MAVTITATRLDAQTYRLEWSSDQEDPTYYIYVDGVLVDTTTEEWRDFAVGENEQPFIEILDAEGTPTPAYSERATLSWQPVSDASSYRVDVYSGGEWTSTGTVVQDTGQSWFSATTDRLADVTTHKYRVVPVSAGGVDGTPIAFTIHQVRRPDVPGVSYSYDSETAVVTISE